MAHNIKKEIMKRVFLAAGMALMFAVASAQQTSNDYIVKTKGVKKTAVSGEGAVPDGQASAEEEVHDFISENFKFHSLCDWKVDEMRFMVMPEKYDMVVKTFHDSGTGKEVSSMSLRHKIMVYKGHTEGSDGHAHINFLCEDNQKMYYYEVPNGTFEDYCYGKMGVPTLAYLGDVDKAREVLKDKVMFTKAKLYRIDTEYDGDGFQEINVSPNTEVKVVAIGVGTRSYPVKIIVEDANGNEFYQNVALSKTNCGMRDDEFIMDNAKYLFGGSFELQDAIMTVSKNYAQYLNMTVHTKFTTDMITKGDGRERTLRVPRMTAFTIEAIMPKPNSRYFTLTLKETESRRIYFKDVTFQETDNVAGDFEGKDKDYFGYLFAMGQGRARQTSQAARAAIRQGRVILAMSEDEVAMAMGEPDDITQGTNGHYNWIYKRSGGKLLVVSFDPTGKVIGTKVDRSKVTKAKKAKPQKKSK